MLNIVLMRRCLFLALLLISVVWARGSDGVIDVPFDHTQDVNRLTDYLIGTANTQRLKAERIYNWIAANINYDVYMLKAVSARSDCTPETVLKRRQSVCAGYARLFEAMARRSGLQVQVVSGVARSLDGQRSESHAWNAVFLDGEWQLLDCTWGAGFVNNDQYHRSVTDFYFCSNPKEFITTHFPNEAKWQLLDTPVSRSEFDRLQPIKAPRAGMGTVIALKDYTDKATPTAIASSGDSLKLPRKLVSFNYRNVSLVKPLQGTITMGPQEFFLEVPLADRVLVMTGGVSYRLVEVPGKVGKFRAQVPVVAGLVKVVAEFSGSGRLEPLLEYEAK